MAPPEQSTSGEKGLKTATLGGADGARPATMPAILVVDDDSSLRGLVCRALENAGYRVTAAADGLSARHWLAQARFDLVVTDIYMPGGDGIELMMHLRGTAPQLPVIAMSGGGRGRPDAMWDVVRHLGVRCVLEKPFSLQSLLDAVQQHVGR